MIAILSVVGLGIATNVMMDTGAATGANGIPAWIWFFGCGRRRPRRPASRFVYITQYYTAGSFRPVREIAEASKTGPATNIITGARGRLRDHGRHRDHDRHRARSPRHWLGSQAGLDQRGRQRRRRHLRHRRRHDGHADDHRLHPGDGHLRPDHRQRRRHRRVQPRRGERPRDHRPRSTPSGNTTKALTKGYAIALRRRSPRSCCSAPTSTRST